MGKWDNRPDSLIRGQNVSSESRRGRGVIALGLFAACLQCMERTMSSASLRPDSLKCVQQSLTLCRREWRRRHILRERPLCGGCQRYLGPPSIPERGICRSGSYYSLIRFGNTKNRFRRVGLVFLRLQPLPVNPFVNLLLQLTPELEMQLITGNPHAPSF